MLALVRNRRLLLPLPGSLGERSRRRAGREQRGAAASEREAEGGDEERLAYRMAPRLSLKPPSGISPQDALKGV
jgi:hypothetical protein